MLTSRKREALYSSSPFPKIGILRRHLSVFYAIDNKYSLVTAEIPTQDLRIIVRNLGV